MIWNSSWKQTAYVVKVKAAISEKEGEIYPDKLPETCRIPAFLEAFMKGEKADAV